MQQDPQSGFTLIALLIASSVFSVILLLCTFGLVRIGQVYYKGTNMSHTQATLRAIVDDVTQAIEYGGQTTNSTPITPSLGTTLSACFGNHRYSYVLSRQLSNTSNSSGHTGHALLVDDYEGACPLTASSDMSSSPGSTLTSGTKEMLTPGMTLFVFDVQQDASGLYNVHIKIGIGDSDLFTDNTNAANLTFQNIHPDSARCRGGSGQQYCAVAEVRTKVKVKVQ